MLQHLKYFYRAPVSAATSLVSPGCGFLPWLLSPWSQRRWEGEIYFCHGGLLPPLPLSPQWAEHRAPCGRPSFLSAGMLLLFPLPLFLRPSYPHSTYPAGRVLWRQGSPSPLLLVYRTSREVQWKRWRTCSVEGQMGSTWGSTVSGVAQLCCFSRGRRRTTHQCECGCVPRTLYLWAWKFECHVIFAHHKIVFSFS